MPRITLAFLIVLVATPLLRAQEVSTKLDFSALEKTIEAELKATNSAGAALAVVVGDKVVYRKGFGLANAETGEAMTTERLFRLGSTTKMFTAATLAALEKEGKLKLDDPVGQHVKGLNPKLHAITVGQLLSHTGGITDEAPMFGLHDDDVLGKGIRAWKDDYLFAKPGQVYAYSNPGYWLAGLVAEEVAGKPFADAVADKVLQPLGMKRSTFRPTLAMTFPLALGHDGLKVIRPMADNSGSWPAGSLFSSVDDLSRFAIAFLNDGKVEGKATIDPGVFKTIAEPRVKIPGTASQYGYGLSIGEFRGVKVVEHSGSRSGYGSIIRFLPERKAAIILLINRSAGALPLTVAAATELLAPLQAKKDPKAAKATELTKEEAARLAGVYSNNRQKMELTLDGDKLFLKANGGSQPMRKIGENRYSAGNAVLTIAPGLDGNDLFLSSGGRALRKLP